MSVIAARSSLDSVSGPQLLLNLRIEDNISHNNNSVLYFYLAGRGFRCISGLDEFVDSNLIILIQIISDIDGLLPVSV